MQNKELQGLSLPAMEEQTEERYIAEASNGDLTSVPESRADAWSEAQARGVLSQGIQMHWPQIRDRILDDLYGPKR